MALRQLYVAGCDQNQALIVAGALEKRGHQVPARWLRSRFDRTHTYPASERARIAHIDYEDILDADALVLVAAPEGQPPRAGGKFVEAGIAFGMNKPVYVIGRRENMLLWHPWVKSFDTVEELITYLDD